MTGIIAETLLTISSSFALSLAFKVTIVSAVILVAYRLAQLSSASVRHLLLLAGFAILLVLPLAAFMAPSLQIQVHVPVRTEPLAIVMSEYPVRPVANHPVAANSHRAGNPLSSLSLSSLITGGWAAGAALFLVPMLAGLWQLRCIRRFGRPWVRGEAILEDLRPGSAVKTPIAVLVHDTIPGPITCGVFRHAIIFPSGAEAWSDADLRRATVHELEHVRRHDCLTHAGARLVCAFYWFHPLVWISWRRLGLEAERACDDAVLSRATATEYADQLVTLAKSMKMAAKVPALAMAGRSDLGARVAAVLDDGRRRGRAHKPGIAAVAGLSLLLTAGISPLRAVSATRQSSEPRQEFEVASIKPKGPFRGPAMIGVEFLPGGLMRAENAPLTMLIDSAYRLSGPQLDFKNVQAQSGFLSLMNEVFDIEAKAGVNEPPDSVPLAERRHRHALMLQSLLADRFKLALHKETREMPMYALVVAPGGPRLKPSPAGRPCPSDTRCGALSGGPANGVKGLDVPISSLVSTLVGFGDRHVKDRTGIEGRFDIELPPWSRPWLTAGPKNDLERAEDPNDPTIFTVLQNQLGLKLESIRGPLDVYVIDHVERPTPN